MPVRVGEPQDHSTKMTSKNPEAQILVVEDERHIQSLLQYLLRPRFSLKVVSHGEEALRVAHVRRFDLFIIDINLGESYTGMDLLRDLRAQPMYANTPAIACTAYALPGDRERFLRAGFDIHLTKPFTRERLLHAVQEALMLSLVA